MGRVALWRVAIPFGSFLLTKYNYLIIPLIFVNPG